MASMLLGWWQDARRAACIWLARRKSVDVLAAQRVKLAQIVDRVGVRPRPDGRFLSSDGGER